VATSYRAEAVAAASPERLWSVVADLAAWPGHTASMTSVRPDGPLAVGMAAVVEQPGLPPTTWTVTELAEGVSFSWTSALRGVRSEAAHRLEPLDGERTRLVLELVQRGAGARVAGLLAGRKVRSYLQMEADGLAAAAAA